MSHIVWMVRVCVCACVRLLQKPFLIMIRFNLSILMHFNIPLFSAITIATICLLCYDENLVLLVLWSLVFV